METGQEKPVSMTGGRWASPGAQGMGLPPGGIRAGSTRGEQYWDQTRGENQGEVGAEGQVWRAALQEQWLGGGKVLVLHLAIPRF